MRNVKAVLSLATMALVMGGIAIVRAGGDPPPDPIAEQEAAVEAAPSTPPAALTGDPQFNKEMNALRYELSPTDVRVLKDSVVQDARAIASGETTAAEVSRDPAKAVDTGADLRFTLLPLLLSVFAPIVTTQLKKWGIATPQNLSAINLAVGGLIAFVAWAALHGSFPDLPQDPVAWIILGVTGGGMGQAGRSTWVNREGTGDGGVK